MLDEGDQTLNDLVEEKLMSIRSRVEIIESHGESIREYIEDLKSLIVRRQLNSVAPVYPAQINWRKFSEIQPEPASEVLIVYKNHVHYAYYNTYFKEGLDIPHFYTKEPFNKCWTPECIDYWSYLPLPPIRVKL